MAAQRTTGTSGARRGRRIPPNFFSIPFGLGGLAECWRAAAHIVGFTTAVATALYLLATVVWLVLLCAYLRQGSERIRADISDQALSPFLALVAVAPLIPASALAATAFSAARVLVIILLAATLAAGGLLTARWETGRTDHNLLHPGYYLPTVAGGLVGADAAAAVGLHSVADALLGYGLVAWLLLGSLILHRMFFHPPLPALLTPTLAIEVAPPVVAGAAYFAVTGGRIDALAKALAGAAVLLVIVQLRRIPLYARLSFTPGFWAFTFSYSAVCLDALLWLSFTRPAGCKAAAIAILTLITMFITGISVRSVLAIRHGRFFPPANAGDSRPAGAAPG